MKKILAWLVLALLLGVLGGIAVAGDDVPGGSSLPSTFYIAGDDVPGGS